MPKTRTHYTVPKGLAGQSLDRVLEGLVEGLTRSQAQKLVRRGDVFVGGKRTVRSNGRLQKGTEVSVEHEEAAPEIQIHFEDQDLVVASKPAGMLTHAVAPGDRTAFAQTLESRFGPLPTSRGSLRPGIVHRLDRDTSGLLVVARSEDVLAQLQDQFRARTVLKRYLAVISGDVGPEPLTLHMPLGPVPGKDDRQQVDEERGKEARTDVQRITAYDHHSLVECTLHTGRRHQIRVHLAERGWPVVADPMYGTKNQRPLPKGVAGPGRLALHASVLGFVHPTRQESLSFEAPLPNDLLALTEALRGT